MYAMNSFEPLKTYLCVEGSMCRGPKPKDAYKYFKDLI